MARAILPPPRKPHKIQLSEPDQIKLMLHLLAVLDGTNAGNRTIAREAGAAIKAMFDLSEEVRSEATRLHRERWADLYAKGQEKEFAGALGIPMPVETETPTPPPVAEESPVYDLPTAKMRKAIRRFDEQTDTDQIDSLRAMWRLEAQI